VLIISTDPAHSLGDALGCKLSASAQAVENFAGSGELFAMEVDTAAAMKRFQETVRDALQQRQSDGGIVGQVLKQLPMQDFVDLFDTLPPGSDEIVALTEVLEKVEKENFDRIIIDTAPTGHAVRLLTYPDFLERLAERVARLRERFGWLSGDSKGPDQVRSFQFRMIELQELFTDPDRSSFSVVTIPTTLALEETKRLLVQLEEQDIRCGLVIANRILDMEQVGQMAASQQKTQQVALEALESLAKREGLEVVRVPYLDREVQGIYGLQYLGRNLVEA
ncbi:ARSA1, partial [Symbiodinium microadriaticum]